MNDLVACPYCKEEIKVSAIKCRFCQSDLLPNKNNGYVSNINIVNSHDRTVGEPEIKSGNPRFLQGALGIATSLIFQEIAADAYNKVNLDGMLSISILNVIIVGAWMGTLLTLKETNKVMPIIAIILSILDLIYSIILY